jgi:hypothetical protein
MQAAGINAIEVTMSGRQDATTTIVVVGTAIAAAALVFVFIATTIFELASAWAKIRYARYPVSEDAIGWGVLISAPLVLALDLGISVGVGVIVFHSLRILGSRRDGS